MRQLEVPSELVEQLRASRVQGLAERGLKRLLDARELVVRLLKPVRLVRIRTHRPTIGRAPERLPYRLKSTTNSITNICSIIPRMRVDYREEPCRSALNRVKGMQFKWSLNPYMGCVHRCTFCYVRAFERRADRPSDDRYGTSIRVKVNVAEVLRRELARRSWEHEWIAIGAATDPYQPAEGRYRLTRGCIEALAEARNPFSIITRGPMIIRDLDVLVEAARRASVSVTFSIPTLDEDVWRNTEPSTAHPRQRLKALAVLVEAGIKAGVGMAPILPGISDGAEQLAEVVRAAREAGATGVWANLLFLRQGTREHFLEHLAEDWPEQVPLYERLYADKAYLGAEQMKPVRSEVSRLAREYEIRDRRSVRLAPPPEPEQLSLTV